MERYGKNTGIQHHPYTSASDVYASGQVIWALMNLRSPRQFRFDQHSMPASMDDKPTAFYPRRLKELMYACIQPLPANRITAEKLWKDIRDEVGVPKGLKDLPMKFRGLPEDEVLNYKHDVYLRFAGH